MDKLFIGIKIETDEFTSEEIQDIVGLPKKEFKTQKLKCTYQCESKFNIDVAYINEQIENYIAQFKNDKNILDLFLNVNPELYLAWYVNSSFTLGIHIKNKTLSALSKLNMSIDFDVYCIKES